MAQPRGVDRRQSRLTRRIIVSFDICEREAETRPISKHWPDKVSIWQQLTN